MNQFHFSQWWVLADKITWLLMVILIWIMLMFLVPTSGKGLSLSDSAAFHSSTRSGCSFGTDVETTTFRSKCQILREMFANPNFDRRWKNYTMFFLHVVLARCLLYTGSLPSGDVFSTRDRPSWVHPFRCPTFYGWTPSMFTGMLETENSKDSGQLSCPVWDWLGLGFSCAGELSCAFSRSPKPKVNHK